MSEQESAPQGSSASQDNPLGGEAATEGAGLFAAEVPMDDPAAGGAQPDNLTYVEAPEGAESTSEEQTSAEGEPASQEEPATPNAESDESARHWQSQYDQLKNEYDQIADVAPIARYIQDDPELLNKVHEHITGQQQPQQGQPTPQSGQAQPQGLQPPERPEKPERPKDYSRFEALNDPDSESAQYEEQMARYQEEMLSYFEQKDQYRESQLQQEQAQIKQQRQAQARMAQMQQELTTQHGLDEAEVQDFFQFMQSPQSLTTENLVKLYRAQKAPSPEEQERIRQARENQARAEKRAQLETPAAATPGQSDQVSAEPGDEGQIFGQSLVQHDQSVDVL